VRRRKGRWVLGELLEGKRIDAPPSRQNERRALAARTQRLTLPAPAIEAGRHYHPKG